MKRFQLSVSSGKAVENHLVECKNCSNKCAMQNRVDESPRDAINGYEEVVNFLMKTHGCIVARNVVARLLGFNWRASKKDVEFLIFADKGGKNGKIKLAINFPEDYSDMEKAIVMIDDMKHVIQHHNRSPIAGAKKGGK
ncbi:MAG: hypothetical protein FWD15_01210 [Alphaproteobacteria bacterium]|nr:hypothetical protein [Alphaproteobacteria bacterium]